MIDEGGENAASFRALADKFGVTPMAITHHVGSRKEMLSDLIALAYSGVASDAEGGDPKARLRFLLVRYCERVLRHPNLIRHVLADPSLFERELVSLTSLIRAQIALVNGTDAHDTVLDLVVDFTHGFAFAASTAPAGHVPSIDGYVNSLDWILNRLKD